MLNDVTELRTFVRIVATGSLSAASSAAAADLQSHRAAAARFACPGWAPPLRPGAQPRVAMAAVLASAP